MTDRSIASRPSLEQVVAIVDFMEKHPQLALGQLRGLEGRDESKKLWFQLTRVVNNISGPTRPMKSWVKYWADKKSTVRSKVQSVGGDPNSLSSNIEKKIYDLFLTESNAKQRRASVKQESHFMEDVLFNDDSMEQNHVDLENDSFLALEEPATNAEDRQMAIMEKLLEEPAVNAKDRQMAIMEKQVKVMGDQATALTQLANASNANSQAMERLAEASQIQARALERMAVTFESIGASSQGVRGAVQDIDATMKRYYCTSPT